MKLEPVTLQGSLVRLEPLRLSHAPALADIAAVDRAGYALTHVPQGEEAMRAYIRQALDQWERGTALPFATLNAASGAVLGSTRFGNAERWDWPERTGDPDAVEIGWTWLAPFARRSGVNTEAKLLMLAHAFEVWRSRRVQLKTDVRNARSRAAIERLGARFEGVLRAHAPAADGGVRDTALYSIVVSEWPEVKAHLTALTARA